MVPTPAAKLRSAPLRSTPGPRRLLDLRTLLYAKRVTAVRWSADGRSLWFEWNATGRFNLWRVRADGGWPVQFVVSDEWTHLQDPSPDGRWVVYTQDVGGNEKPNVYLVSTAGGPPVDVTRTEGVGYHSVHWLPDSSRLVFAAEREEPGAYCAYLLDPATGQVVRVAGNERGQCAWVRTSPDGRWLAINRTHDYAHCGVSVVDLKDGGERVLAEPDDRSTVEAVAWTPDGRLFVTSNRNPQDLEAAALLDLDGRVTWLWKSEWETRVAAGSPADGRYLLVEDEAGEHRLWLCTLAGDRRALDVPGGVLTAAQFSPDGHRIALVYESADRPPDLWVVRAEDAEAVQLSDSLVGGLGPEDFVRPQRVVYPSFDGTPIAAFAYVPRGARPDGSLPAVVYVHGGPASIHANAWFPHLQHWVSCGFLVLCPNYRGSTGFGRAFQEANRKDLGGGDLRDVVAAVDYLRSTGYVDPQRVAVAGGSYGGYLTLMALAKFPEVWAAGVAIVPFANWFTEYEHEDPVLQAYDRMMMGDPVEDAELWRDRSPIFFADGIRAPLLILSGANDIRCPVEETHQVAEAVRRAGGVAEVHVYPDEGHRFGKRENQLDAFERAARFLRAHLGEPTGGVS